MSACSLVRKGTMQSLENLLRMVPEKSNSRSVDSASRMLVCDCSAMS